jgi:hypothetical protein
MKFTIELDDNQRPALFANGVRLPGAQSIVHRITPYYDNITVEFTQLYTDNNKFEWVTNGTSIKSGNTQRD